MKYLKIVDWDKYQTYRKDRGLPPWIKVHRSMLQSQRWLSLTDAEKGQLVSIWVVAAAKGGKIPADPEILQRMAQLKELPNLEKFKQLKYIAGTRMTTKRQPNDAPDTDTDTDTDADAEPGWQDNAFEEDWESYPRKAGSKKKAKVCYLKSVTSKIIREVFQAKTNTYIASVRDPAFLKHGETWFRNWKDHAIDQAPKAKTKTREKLDVINEFLGAKNANSDRPIIQDGDGHVEPLRIESGGGVTIDFVEKFGK